MRYCVYNKIFTPHLFAQSYNFSVFHDVHDAHDARDVHDAHVVHDGRVVHGVLDGQCVYVDPSDGVEDVQCEEEEEDDGDGGDVGGDGDEVLGLNFPFQRFSCWYLEISY